MEGPVYPIHKSIQPFFCISMTITEADITDITIKKCAGNVSPRLIVNFYIDDTKLQFPNIKYEGNLAKSTYLTFCKTFECFSSSRTKLAKQI